MLNSNINIDLHIHSKASEYKDHAIVSNSTIENCSILFENLEANKINMFSITDHNRFDVTLYNKLKAEIASRDGCVSTILPGIEFDVTLNPEMKHCHIIAIFNAKDWGNDLGKIAKAINDNLLTDVGDAYTIEKFENILRKIGLGTILIAHQHSGLRSHGGRARSLSESTKYVEEYLNFGYIDALEYNKPRTQGILLDELLALDRPIATVIGSDCHEWSSYPCHDSSQSAKNPFYTTARCLPTFEGLLLAFTAPDTRFNVRDLSYKQEYLKEINIGDDRILLSPGINAIIGENGAGKSSLLKLIVSEKPKKLWVKKFEEAERITIHTPILPDERTYIEQSQLQNSFNDGRIFDPELFLDIFNEQYIEQVRSYSNTLKEIIRNNISQSDNLEKLTNMVFELDESLEGETFAFNVVADSKFSSIDNPHKEQLVNLKLAISKLRIEVTKIDLYEKEEIVDLKNVIKIIEQLKTSVQMKSNNIQAEKTVRSLMVSIISDYNAVIAAHRTDVDFRRQEYRSKKEAFLESIAAAIKDINHVHKEIPVIHLEREEGVSSNPTHGFNFTRSAAYAQCENPLEGFFEGIFNTSYQSLDALLKIKTTQEVVAAVSQTKENDWRKRWDELLDKFISKQIETKDYILDPDNDRIGNTLGEMSLTYYKYQSQNDTAPHILIIDQPEDNISNNKIHDSLIGYINTLRYDNQIIMVTHNPLLVVNQDVDNVIVLEVENGNIKITSGCLESTEEEPVLPKIAKIMDGGRKAIERRLTTYGQFNKS